MKIYVVWATYCEDTVVCGATLDEATANLIAACEENIEPSGPDCVWIDEFETNDYAQLENGLHPFRVIFYHSRTEIERASMRGFCHGEICDRTAGRQKAGRQKYISCHVFAPNEEAALDAASMLVKTYKERKRIIDETNYVSEPHQWKDR